MSDDEYRSTLMDRYGSIAIQYMQAGLWGIAVGVMMTVGLFWRYGFAWQVLLGPLAGAFVFAFGVGFGIGTSGAVKRFYVDGTSTPYERQYSYQDALVMQRKVGEAIESFRAIIAEAPLEVEPRLRLAELYWRERREAAPAAELFQEVIRMPNAAPGQDIYATNRLVDLLTGPLDDPGRAIVELRRLIERRSGSAGAERARITLAALKERHFASDRSEAD